MAYGSRCLTMQGEMHSERNLGCQDASGTCECDDCAVAAVADGHGGEEYVRSADGSRIAITTALEVLSTELKRANFADELHSGPESSMKKIGTTIISKWRERVREHFDHHPLNDKELKKTQRNDNSFSTRLYGTTLLAGAVAGSFTIGLEIGDGAMFQIGSSGEVKQICQNRTEDVIQSGATDSLCDENPLSKMRFYWEFGSGGSAIIAFTDGFTTANNPEDYGKYARAALCVSDDQWFSSIAPLADECTKRNNKDDCSIAVAYNATMSNSLNSIYHELFNSERPKTSEAGIQHFSYKLDVDGHIDENDTFERGEWLSDLNNHYRGIIKNGQVLSIETEFFEKGTKVNLHNPCQDKELNSFGIETDSDGRVVYEGIFKNGRRSGEGIQYTPFKGSTNCNEMKGTFADGHRNGVFRVKITSVRGGQIVEEVFNWNYENDVLKERKE